MKIYSIDTETHLIQPGNLAPTMVCLSVRDSDENLYLLGGDSKGKEKAFELLKKIFKEACDKQAHVVGHHIFYDLGVIDNTFPSLRASVFLAMDKGMVHCTKIRQQMIDNAHGELKYVEDDNGDLKANDFSLQALVKRHLNIHISKGEDTWRLRYKELDGVPIDKWPEKARQYAIDDADYTYKVFQEQEKIFQSENIPGETWTTQAAWALHLMSIWGIRTDKEAVEKLRSELVRDTTKFLEQLKQFKLIREDNSKDTKAIRALVEEAFNTQGKEIPLTEKGQTSTARDTLIESGDERLEMLSEATKLQKVLTTYVPVLLQGVDKPINANYNAVLETYRTSCSRPNMQNPPRKGGVRECFVARPGYVFVTCDYDTLELRALAQVCLDMFGFSAMADALKKDMDLHIDLAATLLHEDYDTLYKRYKEGDPKVEEARQFCKIGNFGLPGGMAAKTFKEHARKSYGMNISLEQAQEIHQGFRSKWFEMKDYFTKAESLTSPNGEADILTFVRSGMVRGKVNYTAVCNGFFQHLAACGAKAALYAVTKECMLDEKSPLFRSHPIVFLHDEILLEVPYSRFAPVSASLAADRLAEVMREEMSKWIPDVPIKCSPVMFRRWYKGAKAMRVGGVLYPSKPITEDGKTKWVED